MTTIAQQIRAAALGPKPFVSYRVSGWVNSCEAFNAVMEALDGWSEPNYDYLDFIRAAEHDQRLYLLEIAEALS